ncbi:hypothetical protein [uncultured Nostoc sp.]|uniref:hypothetical protein n=1 Tax=uncultured Nostoc sp. TaxID=340711 RepID=UPI0035CB5E23
MELIENHAYHTYDDYLKTHEVELKAQIAPKVAINYYRDGDLCLKKPSLHQIINFAARKWIISTTSL